MCLQCDMEQDLYSSSNCKMYWECTAEKLLLPLNKTILRENFARLALNKIGHTPMWLRIHSNKLYCVVHPDFRRSEYRLKIYRATHYIARLNRILNQGKLSLQNGTDWWSHHSDWVKVPTGSNYPPVFSVSGAPGFDDIAGIPFMSFSDRISVIENAAFQRLKGYSKYDWKNKKPAGFFHGSLSDCGRAVNEYAGNINHCARAKVVYHAKLSQNPLLSGISTISDFRGIGLNEGCRICTGEKLLGDSFIHNLSRYKYVIDFAGAGNWSRRMSLLLRSGGLILQSEKSGYQFYEYSLEPGLHYITFDPQIGKEGLGNLLSRLEWAQKNDEIAELIARRSQSFGQNCLTEASIDYFVSTLITKYSKYLQGNPIPFPIVDLSSCVSDRKGRSKLNKICGALIEKCWLN